jgi:UDP-N-acetylmuramoyl-L-alanyl-D-glutamate--2,6-diaminopimelate ligase
MSIKNSRFVKFFYNLPGISSTYHFLWAWGGGKIYWVPRGDMVIIGITGTKGKTTTLELLNAILETAGKRTALISSLRVKVGDKNTKNHLGNSMPGHGYLQQFLKNAARAHCDYALVEVTSQGVVAHRHRFIRWNIGVLTNLSPEHIEAHGSFENYRQAKLSFLSYVIANGGKIFLNRDDKHCDFFINAVLPHEARTSSRRDTWLENYLPKIKAEKPAAAPFLFSDFNEENVAIAVAIARELQITDDSIEQALADFQGVKGRMEFVRSGPYVGVVDYAHTPDSLRVAYGAVKPKPSEENPTPRLICILGAAGGGRDKWKRSEMGQIAAEYCDEIILTDEDPYDEKPEAIVDEILKGVSRVRPGLENVHQIMDRRGAIKRAFSIARPGDVVIGTGKGSEDWIHIDHGKKIPWNERGVFEEILREKA